MNKDHLDAISVLTEEMYINKMQFKLTDCSESMHIAEGLDYAISVLANASMGYAPTEEEMKEYADSCSIDDKHVVWDDEDGEPKVVYK